MARSDLVGILGLGSLKGRLDSPPNPKWGRIEQGLEDRSLQFTRELSERVLQEFLSQESFLKSDPVLLGSWARGELCPASDLDLLFLGPEEEVAKLVRWAQEKGFKIRSRLPEDFFDLSKGVELWDQLSLLDGKALTQKGEEILSIEKHKILNAKPSEKKKWLKKLKEERAARHQRFDSIQNLLEPNLKMGLGGLRDLQQSKIIQKLFPELATQDSHVDTLLDFYLKAFLWIRVLLHNEGQGDLIAGALQPQLASQLGFEDYRKLMHFVQRGLSRVSFYADWLLEEAGLSKNEKKRRNQKKLKTPAQLTDALIKDPSVLTQYEVRRSLEDVWPAKTLEQKRKQRGIEIKKLFSSQVTEKHWLAFFRSRLMDRLLPELKPLVGYVQHDQYHRFTADAHILQVLREVLRARKSHRHLTELKRFLKPMTDQDWKLLIWTALYHDIAKGRPEDHSDLGSKWTKRDLKAFGQTEATIKEVQWLVKNHLAFSSAALRRDPQDSLVLQELSELDLNEGRIRRLLVFTALDILGTNPKSWNEWKGKLLANLGDRLLDPDQKDRLKLLKDMKDFSSDEQNRLLEISKDIGIKALKTDLDKIRKEKTKDSFRVIKAKKRVWVRYHQQKDRSGTLARVLGVLFQSGASVLTSSVMTLPGVGVYDWFCLEFTGRVESLEKRISLLSDQSGFEAPKVKWDRVELIREQADVWTLLFHGQDQRGLLWNAAQELSLAGAEIISAHAQTWGEKAEDLFVIKAPVQPSEEWLKKFRNQFDCSTK